MKESCKPDLSVPCTCGHSSLRLSLCLSSRLSQTTSLSLKLLLSPLKCASAGCPLGTLPWLRRPPGLRSHPPLRLQTPRTQFSISDVCPNALSAQCHPSSSHHPPHCKAALQSRHRPAHLPSPSLLNCTFQFTLDILV